MPSMTSRSGLAMGLEAATVAWRFATVFFDFAFGFCAKAAFANRHRTSKQIAKVFLRMALSGVLPIVRDGADLRNGGDHAFTTKTRRHEERRARTIGAQCRVEISKRLISPGRTSISR